MNDLLSLTRFEQLSNDLMLARVDDFERAIKGWTYCSWTKSNFTRDLPKKWDLSFVLYEGAAIVGFCIASEKLPEVYYIHLLFVAPSQRQKSFGTEMIEHATKIARSNGMALLQLRCPESNEDAIRFYLRNQFRIVERINDEISREEPDYLLEVLLT